MEKVHLSNLLYNFLFKKRITNTTLILIHNSKKKVKLWVCFNGAELGDWA